MYKLTLPFNKSPNKITQKDPFFRKKQPNRQPNITQIKNEIESILKRSSSPLALLPSSNNKKSQTSLDYQTLEHKRSKMLGQMKEQNFQKTINHRKTYQQFLLADLTSKKNYKSMHPGKQIYEEFNTKQAYGDLYKKQLINGKQTGFDSHHFNVKSNSSQNKILQTDKNMFTERQYQKLGLGKLLFHKNSNVKVRRKDLLTGITSTEKTNLFKQTAFQSFHHQPNIDFSKYLKPTKSANIQGQGGQKIQNDEPKLKTKRSLQVFKKQIIPKISQHQQYSRTINPQEVNIVNQNYYKTSTQKLRQKIIKYELSPHFIHYENDEQNQTLNVLDEQLLIYYGKLKSKRLQNKTSKAKVEYKNHRFVPKHANCNQKNLSLTISNQFKTNSEIKTPSKHLQQQKFQHLNPWQKFKFDDQNEHQSIFPRLSSKMGNQGSLTQNFQHSKDFQIKY